MSSYSLSTTVWYSIAQNSMMYIDRSDVDLASVWVHVQLVIQRSAFINMSILESFPYQLPASSRVPSYFYAHFEKWHTTWKQGIVLSTLSYYDSALKGKFPSSAYLLCIKKNWITPRCTHFDVFIIQLCCFKCLLYIANKSHKMKI